MIRKFHNRCQIHLNVFSLSKGDNVATFWLHNLGDYIGVVIQGTSPWQLLATVKELISNTQYNYPGMTLNLHYICPVCLTDMIVKQSSGYEQLPEDVIDSKYAAEEVEASEGTMCCSKQRHRLPTSIIVNGYYPVDKNLQGNLRSLPTQNRHNT